MVNPSVILQYEILIDFPTEWGSNLAGVLPFVLPLLFGAILLLLYQRYLPRKDTVRTISIFVGIVGLLGAFILVLYAGFGSMDWIPGEISFGSYDLFDDFHIRNHLFLDLSNWDYYNLHDHGSIRDHPS